MIVPAGRKDVRCEHCKNWFAVRKTDQEAQLAAFVVGLKALMGDKFPHLGLVQALLDDYNSDMKGEAKAEFQVILGHMVLHT